MTEIQRVLLTTSRRPAENMRTLCRDLHYSIPFTVRINRGKLSLERVAEKCVELYAKKVVIIERWKRGFGKILLFNVEPHGLEGVPSIIYVRHANFRRDFGEQVPKGWRIKSIAITTSPKQNFEAEKLEKNLSKFFTLPILSPEEAIKRKYDAAMQILTDSLKRITITFRRVPEMVEVGPRISVWRLIWELKT